MIGHDVTLDRIRRAIGRGRFTGSFLLVGPPGVGKTDVALLIAAAMFCERSKPADLNPCGQCPSCLQVAAGTHPDLVTVAKPPDRVSIPIDLLVGPPDARLQSGFCHDLQVRPVTGDRRVAILWDADTLSEEAANCLLKTIEEPPRGSIVMLIGTNEQRQLPTIRSRCRTLRLGPLAIDDAVRLLRTRITEFNDAATGAGKSSAGKFNDKSSSADPIVAPPGDAELAAAIQASGGDLVAAQQSIIGSDSKRDALAALLDHPEIDPAALTKVLTQFHDDAGREAPRRREALRHAFGIAIASFRNRMRRNPDQVDGRTLTRLDRSVRAVRQVDRMANQGSLIQAYAADISLGRSEDDGGINS